MQVGRAQPGEWVAVHGCGGVGLSAVMIAAALGARVVGLDVSDAALERGARAPGRRWRWRPGADVRELTGGGAHVSLDAIGDEAALRRARSAGCASAAATSRSGCSPAAARCRWTW